MIESAFTGEIRLYGGLTPPAGWLPCDGRLLNIDEYVHLYVLIQTTYGGDDHTTFGLPDLRGRVPVHQSPSTPLGGPGGAEQVTLTPAHMPTHTHSVAVQSAAATDADPSPNPEQTVFKQLAKPEGTLALFHSEGPTAAMGPMLAEAAGGGQPHENMPPFLVAGQYIICYDGMTPSKPGEEAS